MKEKTKPLKLPKDFTGNLESLASNLHGLPFSTNLAKMWKVKETEARKHFVY